MSSTDQQQGGAEPGTAFQRSNSTTLLCEYCKGSAYAVMEALGHTVCRLTPILRDSEEYCKGGAYAVMDAMCRTVRGLAPYCESASNTNPKARF
jgi:hypothetical protein